VPPLAGGSDVRLEELVAETAAAEAGELLLEDGDWDSAAGQQRGGALEAKRSTSG
jgi:hypothetical protein